VGSVDSSAKGTFNGGVATPELSGLAQRTPAKPLPPAMLGAFGLIDSAYIYVCAATGNIKRAPLTSWQYG
jgi:hypothetical protein